MRRWIYRATFSLILLSLPVWAQRGGGGHAVSGGGFASHSSGSFHSGPFHSSGSFHGGSFAPSSGVRLGLRSDVRSNVRSGVRVQAGRQFRSSSNRRRVFINGRYYPYGFYPYAGYYPWYPYSSDYVSDYQNDDYQNDNQPTADAYASESYPGPYREDSGLQRDVQTLSGKIDRLQADAEARNHPKTQEPATALVFRDQHVEEVHNYAISGGTLWVLNDSAAKKIPLAQLDIPATVKINDDRGVEFQVPGPALSLRIMN
jgi:hypothetical protein